MYIYVHVYIYKDIFKYIQEKDYTLFYVNQFLK